LRCAVMPQIVNARSCRGRVFLSASVDDGAVDDFLTRTGGALLVFVVPWMLWDLVIYGLLTPTKKSPARPGDLENRRYFGPILKVQAAIAAVGAVLLAVGLAML
jgi:hypothetical protein